MIDDAVETKPKPKGSVVAVELSPYVRLECGHSSARRSRDSLIAICTTCGGTASLLPTSELDQYPVFELVEPTITEFG